MKSTKRLTKAVFVNVAGASSKFSCLICVSVLFFSSCGTPSLLQTAEIREGFSVTMKFSYSLVDEEVVDTYSGVSDMADAIGEISVWVIPKYAFGIRPAWGRAGYETGIDIELVGIDTAVVNTGIGPFSIEPYLKLRWVEEGCYRLASVITFPSLWACCIAPFPRAYLVGDYELNDTFTFYSSFFLDHRGLFGQGRPIGVGLLAGVDTKFSSARIDPKYATVEFPAELGVGWYREYGIHPFVGAGISAIKLAFRTSLKGFSMVK
ncbi:hypothetical protein H8E77_08465 [bacterium]|nr:hypothetical protein [bacterium]